MVCFRYIIVHNLHKRDNKDDDDDDNDDDDNNNNNNKSSTYLNFQVVKHSLQQISI
jgi:hypothetical protein